jgi:predicted DCC family thiol-disulfide oxidoreductase YuxK
MQGKAPPTTTTRRAAADTAARGGAPDAVATGGAQPLPSSGASPTEPGLEVFFDGDCPLCVREIGWLRRRDRAGRVRFTDIAAPEFDAAAHGVEHATLMAQIHARTADGQWVTGVDVFRGLYTAVGFGPVVAITRWPIVAPLLNVAYAWFARNRLRLTGRCSDGTCAVPVAGPPGPGRHASATTAGGATAAAAAS